MKLAISNIGWAASEEPSVAKELQNLGVRYVEIAPTKVWQDPLSVTDEQIKKYKAFWAQHDIEIVAFQSMLFGRTDLTLFDDEATRQATRKYLEKFIELAGRMQVGVLVFGSPKNRQLKTISSDAAWDIAKKFFMELGTTAQQHNTHFCIEPNAKVYDCNFVTTAAEGLALVKAVNAPGFRLHLDAAIMSLEGDEPGASITAARDYLQHFHISAPYLELIEEEKVNHAAMSEVLRSINYQNFTSIEMRPGDEGTNVQRVRQAVTIAQKYYN